MMRSARALAAAVAAFACLGSAPARAFDLSEFKDPDSGDFDLSDWLLNHKGFLLVPIVITEPAVGYGGGLTMAFFRDSMANSASNKSPSGSVVPPDIFAVALAATENGTKGGGVGGTMSFAGDRWRYRGGLGKASVNLQFYGLGTELDSADKKIGYNLDGWMTMQQALYRIGSTNAWVSARWIYLDLKSSFDVQQREDSKLPDASFATRSSGLGGTVEYDSRDSVFTSSSGWSGSFDFTFYDPAWGSSNTFQSYRAHAFSYFPIGNDFVLGTRADGRAARGDVPFYQLPFVDMRGVPAARLQNHNTGVLEAELRWNVTPRWALIGMLGAGRAWGENVGFSDASTAVSKGVGFRYLVARRLELYAGLDYAKSNYDQAVYLTIGSAWR